MTLAQPGWLKLFVLFSRGRWLYQGSHSELLAQGRWLCLGCWFSHEHWARRAGTAVGVKGWSGAGRGRPCSFFLFNPLKQCINRHIYYDSFLVLQRRSDGFYLQCVPVPGAQRAAGCPLCSAGEEDDGRWREAAGCFYCCSHSTTSASSPLKTEKNRSDSVEPGNRVVS